MMSTWASRERAPNVYSELYNRIALDTIIGYIPNMLQW